MRIRAMVWMVWAAAVAMGVAGCGGSDSGPEVCQVGVSTMQFPTGCPTENGTGTVGVPTLTLALKKDESDTAVTITQVSPVQPGTLQALVKDSTGKGRGGVAVAFTTSDKTGGLVPASGTALTNDQGEASVLLPAGAQAGAFTARASAIVGGQAITGTFDYAVTFPTLTFSPLRFGADTDTISAGGTTAMTVTVFDGSKQFTPTQSVTFSSPCSVAGKATIGSPVLTVGGVATASYTDKGCGGPDTITATTTLAGATATQTGTLTVLGATAGQIAFVSALPQNIAMKGTGGPGRQESSTVTFKVLDSSGNPTGGVEVDFFVFSNTGTTAGTGGLTLNPSTGTTAADGTVSTVVSAGIVNTPVRISATVSGTSPAVTSISDQLVISTGIPDQNSFSLSTEIFNTEGMQHDGCDSPVGSRVTVSLADHFNNPVPDGTAVSFTAEGGSIGASCLTGLVNTQLTNGEVIVQKGIPGRCSVSFCAAQPRPDDGRITILAYALGEESFYDDPALPNSINRYDPTEEFEDLCEPFRSDAAITNAQANPTLIDAKPGGAATCPSPKVGEPYIDTNGDGRHNNTGDGQYNGVLNIDPVTQQTVVNSRTPTVHVRSSLVQVLSTSEANITPLSAVPVQLDKCVDGVRFVNTAKTFAVAVRDSNPTVFPGNSLPGNILPAGTSIAITAANGEILGESSYIVPSTNAPSSAAWTYFVSIQSDATQSGPETVPPYVCSNPVASGPLTVKVTTPLGLTTTRSFSVTD